MQSPDVSLVALLDDETSQFILALRQWLVGQGFPLLDTVLPPHLFLCGYPLPMAAEACRLAQDAALHTRGFSFMFSHVGMMPGGETLFLAPETNRPLLSLRERFLHARNTTLHTPLLTVSREVFPQIVPYIVENVKPMEARITGLAVVRRDGAMLMRKEV